MRRKDLCGSVRAVYVLEKLPDVSGHGLVEAGRYRNCFGFQRMDDKVKDGLVLSVVWC